MLYFSYLSSFSVHGRNFMRSLSFFLCFISIILFPLSTHAQEGSDAYADSVYQASNQVYQPESALGAPDGSYAQFLERDASLILDMGAEERGIGDLIFTYQVLNFGASYRVEFLNEDFEKLQTSGAILSTYDATTTISYTAGLPYRYVRVTSTEEDVWKLDNIQAVTYEIPEEIQEQPQLPDTSQTTEEPVVTNPSQGLLLKLPDDGDVTTQNDSAVYTIGSDGKRHGFPTTTSFQSWWKNFSEIELIDSVHMSEYELGKNVVIRPGTYLVKIVSDPKVYAVEPGGILRWVTTEEIARSLYGDQWTKRVVDIPDAFFTDYEIGAPIETAVHPSGTVGVLTSGIVIYLQNGLSYNIPGDVYQSMRFESNFLVALSQETMDLYVDAGNLTNDPTVQFPF